MNRIYPSMIAPHAPFGTPMQPGALASREDTAGLDPLRLSDAIRLRPAEQFAENAKIPAPSCAPGEVTKADRDLYARLCPDLCSLIYGGDLDKFGQMQAIVAFREAAALSPQGRDAKEGDTVPLYTADEAWEELLNKDDRTSPEEYPDMCLIEKAELRAYMELRQYGPATPSQRLDAATVEREEAMRDLLDCADQMPKKTPAPGHSATEHQFTIEAGVIWSLDRAVQRLRRALATEPHQHGGKAK